jgi:predicted RNase H-like HicB family nuclease
MKQMRFTAIIERERGGYVSLCPELDVASQGNSVDEARANLREAVELFLESASEAEVNDRLGTERRVETLDVQLG